jgi:elongation factor 1-alpha
MITGASQADACILFCSAKKGEFEAGIGAGGQTLKHAFLAFTLGIRQAIVAITRWMTLFLPTAKNATTK